MKKTIYVALGALTILTNLANAAGFLATLPRMDTIPAFHMQMMPMNNLAMLGKLEEGIQQDQAGGYAQFLRGLVAGSATARDISIVRKLAHLNDPAAGVADPYGQILAQAQGLLAVIPGITPEETDVWTHFYSLCVLNKGWRLPQMAGDHSHMGPGEVIPHAGGNIIVPAGPVDYHINGLKVDFDTTMADFHQKLNSYRATAGLPAL
jgi:hypothetical protein